LRLFHRLGNDKINHASLPFLFVDFLHFLFQLNFFWAMPFVTAAIAYGHDFSKVSLE
jgi:hypothetical protein